MLKIELAGSVVQVVINRPEVRNALNKETIENFISFFEDLSKKVRVVVIRGEGTAFCAGGDLEDMRNSANSSVDSNYEDALRLGRVFRLIKGSSAVVISAVHGHCFGGGCGIVAASDLTIASESALFCFSEAKLGLTPATIGDYVVEKIGPGNAKSYFVTAEPFNASIALRIGLVYKATSDGDLNSEVNKTVRSILQNGPEAIRKIKSNFEFESLGLSKFGDSRYEEAAKKLAEIRATPEGKEGVSAFLEKRPPSYKEEYTI